MSSSPLGMELILGTARRVHGFGRYTSHVPSGVLGELQLCETADELSRCHSCARAVVSLVGRAGRVDVAHVDAACGFVEHRAHVDQIAGRATKERDAPLRDEPPLAFVAQRLRADLAGADAGSQIGLRRPASSQNA